MLQQQQIQYTKKFLMPNIFTFPNLLQQVISVYCE